MTQPVRLGKYCENNVYSQFGEDGVVQAIFEAIGLPDHPSACEFGAWDGKWTSNVAALAEAGWRVCFIEGDAKKCQELRANYAEASQVACVEAFVTPEGANSVEEILNAVNMRGVLDFLVIDIDGNDIHCLNHLERRHRVIAVEFNPTLGPVLDFSQPYGKGQKGCSLTAIAAWAEQHRYRLVYATYCNAFLVRYEDADGKLEAQSTLEAFQSWEAMTIVGSYYDGQCFLLSGGTNPWDGTASCRVKSAPWGLRGFPPGIVRRVLRFLWKRQFLTLWRLMRERKARRLAVKNPS